MPCVIYGRGGLHVIAQHLVDLTDGEWVQSLMDHVCAPYSASAPRYTARYKVRLKAEWGGKRSGFGYEWGD